MSREQVEEIVGGLEGSVARPECLTCDCFQGLLTQLELDFPEGVSDLTGRLKCSSEEMHGCLGCDPCPGSALFAKYLKVRNNNR